MYEDTYSALFEWNLVRWAGDDSMAAFMTAAGLTGAIAMNIVMSVGILVAVFGPSDAIPRSLAFVVPISLFMANYVGFVHKRRYVRVLRRFRQKAPDYRRRIGIIAWSYILASYGLPVMLMFGMAALTQG